MEKFQYFDGLKFTRDNKTGYYLNSTLRKRIHRYVWEFYNGDIPKGHHIHHIDGNKSNNDISNLQLLSASEHTRMHAKEMVNKNYDKIIKNLEQNVRPKAIEWHKSKEGKDWHKKQYQLTLGKYRGEKVNKICKQCGCDYQVEIKKKSYFCSNNCKSKFRRDSGIDDVVRVCINCGKDFTVNKYKKTTRCCK